MTPSAEAKAIAGEIDRIVEICLAAHEVILPYWQTELEVEAKDDESPVTLADKAANNTIVAALKMLTPEVPIVSEEGHRHPLENENDLFWLVDPLDGTKSFIKGLDEFTVNIALVENRHPVLGVLGVPARGLVYKAAIGQGAWRKEINETDWQSIQVSPRPQDGIRVVSSRSHRSPKLVEWLQNNGVPVKERVAAGSALKFGLVAEGLADLYPRIGPTMEWDTAAGHCLIEAAGGIMTDLNGEPFLYGKQGYLNGGFVVRGSR